MSAVNLFPNGTYPPSMSDPDNRDPMQINKHLQLDFFNVIAEPDPSAYNFEVLHRTSHHVYHYSKVFMYRLLTILVGLPLMLFWGLLFGVYTFLMIWLAAPARRLMQSCLMESGLYVQTMSDAVIGPLCHSMGHLFSNIRVFSRKENIELMKPIQA